MTIDSNEQYEPYETLDEPAKITRLIKAFEHVEEEEYLADGITEALIQIGEPAVIPLIITAIENYSDVGWWAIRTLAFLKDKRTFELFVGILATSSNVNRIIWSAFALGEFGDPRAIEFLIKKLTFSDRNVRYYTVEALGRLGVENSQVLLALETLQKSERDFGVRYKLAEALDQLS